MPNPFDECAFVEMHGGIDQDDGRTGHLTRDDLTVIKVGPFDEEDDWDDRDADVTQ